MARKDDELLQTGHKPKPKSSRDGTPKIIWVALLVCIIGAALLFRNPSSDVPTGIGENRTVVTVPAEQDLPVPADSLQGDGTAEAGPRSGEVDLDQLVAELTPESPSSQTVRRPPLRTPSPQPEPQTPVREQTDRPRSDPPPPLTPTDPKPRGNYVVQTGSFGGPENADKEALRLQALGWDALVKVSDMADGSIVYRVQIGYFATKTEADTFIRANRKELSGSIPVHR